MNAAFVLTACLSIALRIIVLDTNVSVRRIRLVLSRVIFLAYASILLGSFPFVGLISRFPSHWYSLVRDGSESVASTSSPVLAPM